MLLKTLADVQVAHPRPYVPPDPPASLPTYPFASVADDPWNDTDDRLERPLTPPALSPRTHKRSGGFALNGQHMFSRVNAQDNDSRPSDDGLPEDMQDILRQLDDLASWVKAASSSTDRVSNASTVAHSSPPGTYASEHSTSPHFLGKGGGELTGKGKNRLPSTSPLTIRLVESSRGTVRDMPTNCQSEGFIYVPNCNTPEFLVGSSSSPVVYPVGGYSSHPPRYASQPPDQTRDIAYRRRLLERRSAPPSSPLVSPPLGKTSFKTLFQRSRCDTTALSRPTIPSGHVPVESALRQGKRMRLHWLRI